MLALTRPKHDSLRDPAANDPALGHRDTRLVAFQSRGRDPIEALRYANGGQIPAVDQPTDRVVADTESLGGFLDRVVALSDDFSPAIDALKLTITYPSLLSRQAAIAENLVAVCSSRRVVSRVIRCGRWLR